MRKTLTLPLIFILFSPLLFITPLPEVKALPSTVAEVRGPPIKFTETADYISLDFTMFRVEFYKGTAGYNKIYNKDGSVLVYDQRDFLQYFASPKWKQRGTPISLSYTKISDYHYEVVRHYDDYGGTTYDIKYTVRADTQMKTTIILNIGKTDEYQVVWSPSGITKTTYSTESNRITFGQKDQAYQWIGFDWTDVYQTFGDITATSIETVAQGRKANIYFNLGVIEAGQTVVIDPVTVGTSTNDYATGGGFVRHTFIASDNYHYVFFNNGSSGGYASSSDGSTFGAFTHFGYGNIGAGVYDSNTVNFDVYWDGSKFHVAYEHSVSGKWNDYYMNGTVSTGVITFATAVNTTTLGLNGNSQSLSIATDTNNVPFIAYGMYDTAYRIKVVNATSSTGQAWNTPVTILAAGAAYIYPVLLRRTSGAMFLWMGARDTGGTDWVWYSSYSGSAWGTATNTTWTYTYSQITGITASDGTVYVVFDLSATVKEASFTTSLSETTTVCTDSSANVHRISVSIDSNDVRYVFYVDTSAYIALRKSSAYSTKSNPFGTTFDAPKALSSTPLAISVGGSISVTWVEGAVPPDPSYNVQYATHTVNTAPTNDALSFQNLDDTNNMYAQLRTYTSIVNTTDADANQLIVTYHIKSGATSRAAFTYTESTTTFAQVNGSTVFGLQTGSCAAYGSAGSLDVLFAFTVTFGATEEALLDITVKSDDGTDTDSDTYSDQFDVVKTLTISSFASSPAEYVNIGTSATFSGTVYYVNNPASSTATTFYPPNAEFTAVHIHDASHTSKGSDTSIVNGAFSVAFNADATAGQDTYHPYIDMADTDYTDADVSGITDTITAESLTGAITDPTDQRVNLNANATGIVLSATYDSDSAPYDGTLVCNDTTFTSATAARRDYKIASASGDDTRAITSFSTNTDTTYCVWDSLTISITDPSDQRVNINANASGIVVSATRDYDSSAFDGTLTLNYTTYTNATAVKKGYTVSSASGGTYGITTISTNDSTYCIWDKYTLTLSPSSQTIDMDAIGSITVTGVSAYDASAWAGSVSTWNASLTSTSIAKKAYKPSTISDPTYGVTSFTFTPTAGVSITFTGLNITSVKGPTYSSGTVQYKVCMNDSYSGGAVNAGTIRSNATSTTDYTTNSTGWATVSVTLSNFKGTIQFYGSTNGTITYPALNSTRTIKTEGGSRLYLDVEDATTIGTPSWTGTASYFDVTASGSKQIVCYVKSNDLTPKKMTLVGETITHTWDVTYRVVYATASFSTKNVGIEFDVVAVGGETPPSAPTGVSISAPGEFVPTVTKDWRVESATEVIEEVVTTTTTAVVPEVIENITKFVPTKVEEISAGTIITIGAISITSLIIIGSMYSVRFKPIKNTIEQEFWYPTVGKAESKIKRFFKAVDKLGSRIKNRFKIKIRRSKRTLTAYEREARKVMRKRKWWK